ncbi:MAG: hypothetical protein KA758_02800 [Acidimicrobiales bacterium]|nr:hypothetical protein [Acidimicrobiales bacterium]
MAKSYFDKDIDTRWWARHPVGAIWLFVGLVLLLSFGGWAFRVATSDIKGKGDTIVRENDADNRIQAQAFFEDTYQGIQRFDTQLNDASKALEEWKANNPPPSGQSSVELELYKQQLNNKQTTATGIQQQCRNAVAAYNAEARKTIRDGWRSADLPYQIDGTDPSTDCEVTAA